MRNPAQVWGSPKIEDDVKLWVNTGYLFSGGQQIYGHGNYVSKKVTGGFYYRNPNTRGGVFSNDGGVYRNTRATHPACQTPAGTTNCTFWPARGSGPRMTSAL